MFLLTKKNSKMKKIMFTLLAFFLVGVMSSCRKDYVCECRFTDGTPPMNIEIVDANRFDARDACETIEITYQKDDPRASCSLN